LLKIESHLKLAGYSWDSESPNLQKSKSRWKILVEKTLDAGYGACILNDNECARIVENSLKFFNGSRLDLISWVIMPNHVHCLLGIYPGFRIGKIVQSIKRCSANQINRRYGRNGSVWFRDYFDRRIRNETHYFNAIEYIHNNPVKAGLVLTPAEWRFSSYKVYCQDSG
jgi:REP element-mobilizing transposase RayT